jgi:2-octaprenyl-6-methoxyphenol hydroxylase
VSALCIVGAGPVGATLALALHRAGRAVEVIEARARRGAPAAAADPRSIALSWGSREILASVGLWEPLAAFEGGAAATPVECLTVEQAGGFARATVHASELGLPALGYVVRYEALLDAADAALAAAGVPVRYGSAVAGLESAAGAARVRLAGGTVLEAAAIALADGGSEPHAAALDELDRHDYGQHALLCEVRAPRLAGGSALERFCHDGVIALLPCAARHMAVWVARAARIAALAAGDPARALELEFRGALGPIVSAGAPATFPLLRRVRRARPGGRVVPIGSAAQALHPVGAQGLNLGLRDARELARALRDTGASSDYPRAIAAYERRRRADRMLGIGATDLLARSAVLDLAAVRVLRGTALFALDVLAPARRWLFGSFVFGLRG